MSVFETSSAPDITGNTNPRQAIAEASGYKELGSMRRTWTEPEWDITVTEITEGDWKLNEATT